MGHTEIVQSTKDQVNETVAADHQFRLVWILKMNRIQSMWAMLVETKTTKHPKIQK